MQLIIRDLIYRSPLYLYIHSCRSQDRRKLDQSWRKPAACGRNKGYTEPADPSGMGKEHGIECLYDFSDRG